MSVDYTVCVGTYLRVVVPVTNTMVDMCADHNRPDAANYCPKCGRRDGGDRFRTTFKYADADYWEDPGNVDRLVEAYELGETRETDRVRILHSNFTNCGGLNIDPRNDTGVSAVPGQASRDAFLAKHDRDITQLRALGCDVAVEFGVLVYAH